MRNPWRSLEEIPGLSAVPAVWRRWMPETFERFNRLCLQPGAKLAETYPCPLRTGCRFWLKSQSGGAFRGICGSNPIVCPHSTFTLSEITPLEVNRQRLGRALSKAFEIVAKPVHFTLPETWQFGAWSEETVPLIMTIQFDITEFRRVIAELALRLGRPFVLFAPTNLHIDAHAQELLAHARSDCFPLDSTVRLSEQGALLPLKPPQELFYKFTPKPSTPLHCDFLGRQNAPAPGPRYMIRKGLGVWILIFDGKEAVLKHERGIFYVAYPIVWTDVLQAYSTSAAADQPIAVFGAMSFWWMGEHGSPRIDTSEHIYFANDQLAVRFIEEIDFDYAAVDATAALLTAAS